MKSVAICGSRRFKTEIHALAEQLRGMGVVVHVPPLPSFEEEWKELPRDQKEFIALGLTHNHFYKIQMADVVYIYNKGGYSGFSTTLEIGYAVATGKPIYALEKDEGEICRHVLFQEIIKMPEELVKRLQ